jgi:hypothetical protein
VDFSLVAAGCAGDRVMWEVGYGGCGSGKGVGGVEVWV